MPRRVHCGSSDPRVCRLCPFLVYGLLSRISRPIRLIRFYNYQSWLLCSWWSSVHFPELARCRGAVFRPMSLFRFHSRFNSFLTYFLRSYLILWLELCPLSLQLLQLLFHYTPCI